MKFCKNCGTLARASNLRVQHFHHCQPSLAEDESGFLENGELPALNLEDFRMVLSIIGMEEKSNASQREHRYSKKPEASVDSGLSNDDQSDRFESDNSARQTPTRC